MADLVLLQSDRVRLSLESHALVQTAQGSLLHPMGYVACMTDKVMQRCLWVDRRLPWEVASEQPCPCEPRIITADELLHGHGATVRNACRDKAEQACKCCSLEISRPCRGRSSCRR